MKNELFRRFDVNNPVVGTAEEEWTPHLKMSDKSVEWWYLTTMAHDAAGRKYFLYFTISYWIGDGWVKMMKGYEPAEGKRYALYVGNFMDLSNGKNYSFSTTDLIDEDGLWDPARNAIQIEFQGNQADWSYKDGKMNLKFQTNTGITGAFALDAGEVVWHKDSHGHQGMIQQGADGDYSFYYSVMRTGLHGNLSFTDDKGIARELRLTGEGWIDRQWGDFYCDAWEWSSFRFNNGARVHIYNFNNDRQEGIYMSADGTIQYFDKVTVKQNGYAKNPNAGIWVSLGWSYEFPTEIEGSREFTVEPYKPYYFIEMPDFNYVLFEGPGRLINDATGEEVGVSINESCDIRGMKNGPYEVNQH